MRIPEVSIESMEAYSGKFVVRVSPVIHKEASECAKKQGISLNQYVNEAILTANVSNAASSISILSCKTLSIVKANHPTLNHFIWVERYTIFGGSFNNNQTGCFRTVFAILLMVVGLFTIPVGLIFIAIGRCQYCRQMQGRNGSCSR